MSYFEKYQDAKRQFFNLQQKVGGAEKIKLSDDERVIIIFVKCFNVYDDSGKQLIFTIKIDESETYKSFICKVNLEAAKHCKKLKPNPDDSKYYWIRIGSDFLTEETTDIYRKLCNNHGPIIFLDDLV